MSLALLLAGLMLGPAYYIYVRFFSGDLVATHSLPVSARGIEGVSVTLAPTMNPIGLIVRTSAAHGPSLSPSDTPRNVYRARLVLGERDVWSHSFTLVSSSLESTPGVMLQQALPLFEVTAPAAYRLEIQPENEPQMQVSSVDVQIRSGMRAPSYGLAAAGVALLVAGAVGVLQA